MPRTRSQTAEGADRIIDPPTNITLTDVARRIVRFARAIHFVAATIEDSEPARTGFIDAIQQSGSRSTIVARKIRNFHEERWRESERKATKKIDYGADDDSDEEREEDVEHQVEAAFDQDYSLEKAVSIATDFEAKAVGIIGDRRDAMEKLRDPEGAKFLEQFMDQYHKSIAKWDRVKDALRVCAEQGGEACLDMTLRRNWWK